VVTTGLVVVFFRVFVAVYRVKVNDRIVLFGRRVA
jgi:hypothetical protein